MGGVQAAKLLGAGKSYIKDPKKLVLFDRTPDMRGWLRRAVPPTTKICWNLFLLGRHYEKTIVIRILGYTMIMKISIFQFLTLLTRYFTMLIVSGMYFSCGFHPQMLKTTPWGPVFDDFCIL